MLWRGVKAGAILAVVYGLSELLVCVGIAGRLPVVDFWSVARSFPAYLLVCLGAASFFSLIGDTAFVYVALSVMAMILFEQASFIKIEGPLQFLLKTPRSVYLVILFSLGGLLWNALRKKSPVRIETNGIALFCALSTFLLIGEWVMIEKWAGPLLRLAPREAQKDEWLRGVLGALAFGSTAIFLLIQRGLDGFFAQQRVQKIVFSVFILVGLLGYLPGWLPSLNVGKPNMILVVLDTVRADHLSSYGYSKRTTPHLDQWAREGALFEQAKATSHWTLPSHASLFTGLFPSRHGADAKSYMLRRGVRTLAEHLRSQGYRTVGFSANGMVGEETGLSRGFDELVDLWQEDRRPLAARLVAKTRGYSPLSAPLLNFLLEGYLRHEAHRPFFLFVNFIEPHRDYRVHPGVSEAFYREAWSQEEIEGVDQSHSAWFFIAGKLFYREKELKLLTDLYDGEVAYVDIFLGELLETLRKGGLLDKSILIITSDHGEYFGEHHLVDHESGLYEEAIHVPLLIRYPGQIAARRVPTPVSLVDIAPTLLELAHLKPMRGTDGKSLVPILKGENKPPSPVVAEESVHTRRLRLLKHRFPEVDFSAYDEERASFQEGEYKAIVSSKHPPELYNLRQDPKESDNLFERFPDHPVLKHLAGYLEKRSRTSEQAPSLSPEKMKFFRSLGYL